MSIRFFDISLTGLVLKTKTDMAVHMLTGKRGKEYRNNDLGMARRDKVVFFPSESC